MYADILTLVGLRTKLRTYKHICYLQLALIFTYLFEADTTKSLFKLKLITYKIVKIFVLKHNVSVRSAILLS